MFDGIIDINHNNDIDLAAAKAAGIVAVIHKATEGATYQDPLYSTRRAQAKELGLLWGAYHFGTAASVDDQIANFLTAAALEDGDLAALDYEENSGNQMSLDQAEEFVTAFMSETGWLPLIYGSNLLKGAGSSSVLGSCKLWIADYTTASQPTLPPLFNSYTLWQFSDGTVLTAGAAVDRDAYDGTQAELIAGWPFR